MHILTAHETTQLDKAKQITAAQVQAAKEIHLIHFRGNDNPEVLAAIIQAVATTFAAVAANSRA